VQISRSGDGKVDIDKAMSKLSRLQREILKWLLNETEYTEANGNDYARNELCHWGVKWNPGRWHYDWTRSDSASWSRTLQRLEIRGLILRTNQCSRGKRATHIKLTEVGREVAKRLT
jgi:DNA-binding MarR family transcriptional regulator